MNVLRKWPCRCHLSYIDRQTMGIQRACSSQDFIVTWTQVIGEDSGHQRSVCGKLKRILMVLHLKVSQECSAWAAFMQTLLNTPQLSVSSLKERQ
eukprot:jgi/Botrbrau1/18513/Bobra.0072s0088.1